MRCAFRSTSNSILTFPVDCLGEYWTDVRERIHEQLFLTERNNIKKAATEGRPIISISKYLTGIFVISAQFGVELGDSIVPGEIASKLADKDIVYPTTRLVMSRSPCGEADRERYVAYYWNVANSMRATTSVDESPEFRERSGVIHQLFAIRAKNYEHMLRDMCLAPEDFNRKLKESGEILQFALNSALEWLRGDSGAQRPQRPATSPWCGSSSARGSDDTAVFARPAPVKKAPSGIPRTMLRRAESDAEKKNAMVDVDGEFVVLK